MEPERVRERARESEHQDEGRSLYCVCLHVYCVSVHRLGPSRTVLGVTFLQRTVHKILQDK